MKSIHQYHRYMTFENDSVLMNPIVSKLDYSMLISIKVYFANCLSINWRYTIIL